MVLFQGGHTMSEKQYEVVVCGGGIAGIAAALAAARNGAKTCLIEREFALGGLATLGLIVVYLPLCDGAGVKMSAGIAEELLKLSIKYGPGEIPEVWVKENATTAERSGTRYRVEYNAASMMIAAEELLLSENVTIFYGAHISGVKCKNGKVTAVVIETKSGKQVINGCSFIDATGDADICWLAGEETVDDPTNRRTGWYFSYDGKEVKRNALTDPPYTDIPEGSRLYSGTILEDITQHCIDGRKMILEHVQSLKKDNPNIYPLIIPSIPGLRMTRRLAGTFEFSEELHENCWFSDAIGMIGNWKVSNKRYSIPYRSIKAVKNSNLFAVGRCCCADKSGWDLTRVIPTCAVTGEAGGTAAAMLAVTGNQPEIAELQKVLRENGVLLQPELFSKKM
jgi:ribulose 1,5-bisphosphate synthetase/thiazole synthase